jgi:hypothetical protein
MEMQKQGEVLAEFRAGRGKNEGVTFHLMTSFGQLSQDACIQRANPEHAYGHSNGTGVRYRFHTGGVCRPSSDAESRTVTIDLR